MVEFVKLHLIDLLFVLAFLFCIATLWRKGKKYTVRKVILSLVVKAEKELGSGTGELKYAMVVERIYYVLPWIVRVFFTRAEIDNMIEDAVEHLKMYLSDESEGKRNLLGYEEEGA
ncbi:hypothetical protein EAL2_c11300 [Peptoclostridium acidaminophilum DSM 3953]|uniref:Uncharacterized protein n=1 Tax=Peptoclostridium acidaminophilum DSM 3953 TaxID=1286171 RepID=W8TF19_PEPAC|nr:hypothetical protein [Peptoclostridium acidaminophilum]AHM56428.1 hypothetical protein EAL2_c11300 [Peptoclostridium acidaminophilum DSM 3953]